MYPTVTVAMLFMALTGAAPPGSTGQDGTSAVRAVLFHSPACVHCRTVLERDLPPLEARWGARLEVLRVDVTTPTGEALYRDAILSLGIPQDRLGVPTLVVGSEVLVGSGEIPERFPGLVEAGMAGAGVAFPRLRGLDAYTAPPETPLTREAGAPAAPALGSAASPDGMYLAWGVLALLVLSLVRGGTWVVGTGMGRGTPSVVAPSPSHLGSLGALLLLGVGTAGYLSATALSAAETVCGPVGDCAAVHASPFAYLLGIPVAVLGVAFYVLLGALWYLVAARDGKGGGWLVAVSLLGVVYSVYLTAMEVFVIRAVCIWCLGSALAAAGLLWLAISAVRPPRTTG